MAIRREIVFVLILAVLYYPIYHVVYGPMRLVLVGWSPIYIGALAAGLIIGLAGALLGLKPAWKVLVLPLVAEALSLVVNLAVFGGLDNWRQAIYGSVEGEEANVTKRDRAFSEAWNVSAVRCEKDSAARKASETEQRPTYRGYDIAGRLSEGYLHKCLETLGLDDYAVGSVNCRGVAISSSLQRWLKLDPFRETQCRDCSMLSSCLGGCPRRWMARQRPCCPSDVLSLERVLKDYCLRHAAMLSGGTST